MFADPTQQHASMTEYKKNIFRHNMNYITEVKTGTLCTHTFWQVLFNRAVFQSNRDLCQTLSNHKEEQALNTHRQIIIQVVGIGVDGSQSTLRMDKSE